MSTGRSGNEASTTSERVSYCRICEQLCGVVVEVTDGRISRIRGDKEHPVSQGYICPKGASFADVQSDPDRVRTPLKRTPDGSFVKVGWDAALDDIAFRLSNLTRRYGPDAVAMYLGNPSAFSLSHMFWAKGLLDAVGSRHFYSANAQDAARRAAASHYLYGSPMLFPIPDVVNTDFLVILGANPMVSHGSLLSLPPIGKHLRAIPKRGGRVVVVDPALTKTAATFEHQPIKPASDAWLLGAMIKVLFDENLVDWAAVSRQASGLDQFAASVGDFTLQRAATATGIGEQRIRQLALDFAASKSAVAYGRVGVCRYPGSTLTNFLIDALNLVTGNFDRRGGSAFGESPVDLVGLAARFGQGGFGAVRSRIGDLPDVAGHMPWVLADEINTPGAGQPRALIMTAGNPVVSAPGGRELSEAIDKLDLVVSIDLYVNDSARAADYILPVPTFLERSDVPLTFSAHMPIPWLQAATPVVGPPPAVREEWWIFEELAKRMGLGAASGQKVVRRLARFGVRLTPRFMMDAMLRTSDAGDLYGLRRKGLSIKKLEELPHGVLMPAGQVGDRAGKHIQHSDGLVRLGSEALLSALRELPLSSAGLVLIGRRQLSSINSWMHNVGSNTDPSLHINPVDAQAYGLETGDEADITTSVGSVRVAVEVTDRIAAGVVSYPHGWGHRGGWKRANAMPGVNINAVLSADPVVKDKLSGASHLDGVQVSLARATPVGPAAHRYRDG